MPLRVYIASRMRHAARWRALRARLADAGAVAIVSSWIDAGDAPDDLAAAWSRCVAEAAACDALVVYAEPGDVMTGALVEVGAALAHGRPVYQVGSCEQLDRASVRSHPLYGAAASVADALVFAEVAARTRAHGND